jgi:general secretion pathway protein A
MYLAHYNLQEKPFQITTDPRFLWLGEKHQEALATLNYGLLNDKGFLLLTGDVGTGKTTLIKALLRDITEKTIVASVVDPKLEKLEFFKFLAGVFGIEGKIDNKVDFLMRFTQFLNDAHRNGRTVLLIIDEAQRLSKELLEETRLLSNIEKENKKLLNIFFVGQDEFNDLLMEESCRALRQRITITHHISPLSESETGNYIRHRLKVAGADEEIFTPKAIGEVYAFARGYPRLINIICDHALLTGYVRERKIITPTIVRECAKELALPGEIGRGKARGQRTDEGTGKKGFFQRPVFYAGISVAAIFFAYFWGSSRPLLDPAGLKRPSDNLLMPQAESTVADPVAGRQSRRMTAPDPPPTLEAETENALPAGTETAQEDVPQDDSTGEAPIAPLPTPLGSRDTEPVTDKAPSGDETISENSAQQSRHTQLLPSSDLNATITFSYDTNDLTPEAYADLDRLASALARNADLEVIVEGHTDALGPRDYNLKLSEFRAHMVKSYFVGRGVTPSRIRTIAMAGDSPRQPNDTAQGRAANRRVEIRLGRMGQQQGP